MISNTIEEIKKGEQEKLAAWIIDYVQGEFSHVSVDSQEFHDQTKKVTKWLTDHFEFIKKVQPETIEYIAHGVAEEGKQENYSQMNRPQKIFELEIRKVERLGEEIGYGNLMSLASAIWSIKQKERYGTTQGVFVPIISEEVIYRKPFIDAERLKTINHVNDVLNPKTTESMKEIFPKNFNDYAIKHHEPHPIATLFHDAMVAVEKLGASPEQTDVIIKLGACKDAIEDLLFRKLKSNDRSS